MPPTAGQAPDAAAAQAAAAATADKAASDAAAAQAAAAATTRSTAEYDAEIRALRAEAAANRVKANQAEERLKKIDDDKLSETEKLTKAAAEAAARAEAAEAKVKATQVQIEIERQARKLKIQDEEAALKLLDHTLIKYDDGGKPTNVEALLTDLVKAKPYLIGTTSVIDGGSAGNPGRQQGGLTVADVKKMTRAEVDANYEAVRAALARGV